MIPPVLSTDRLVLSPPQLSDFPHALRLWSEPAVTRYIGGKPRTETEVWDALLKKSGQWALLGYGYWTVTLHDGTRIGEAGFALNRRLLDPAPADGWPLDPEIGWAFSEQAQGRGLAGEAVAACLAWGDAKGFPRTVCLIDAENAPSLRLAARQGFQSFAHGGLAERPMQILERRRPG